MGTVHKDDATGDLFATPTPVLPVDYRSTMCELVAAMLREFPGDRYAASAEISRRANRSVSKCMLDGYTSPAREEFNLPAYVIPALENTCNSRLITRFLATSGGGRVVFGPEVIDAEIGRMERQRDELNARIGQMRKTQRGSK